MALFDIQQPLPSTWEKLTVTNAVKQLTATKYAGKVAGGRTKNAAEALITVEADQIRWTCDGTDPSATDGHRANVDDIIRLQGYDAIRLFKAIRLTTDATIQVTYFGG